MPYELLDLVVDRVDLVDEGANSAAFIELYKRKEKSEPMDFNEIVSKLKPEHAEVVKGLLDAKDEELVKATEDLSVAKQSLADTTTALEEANDALAKANAELETLKAKSGECECDGEADEDGKCKSCGKPKKSFDETETIKSMPEPMRSMYLKMRTQKEAAEEQVRKNAAEKVEAEAVAKAASLKAIPVEQSKLVGVIKSCSPEMLEILTLANTAIETAVLGEVGKNKGNGAGDNTGDAWSKIEKKAEEIVVRDGVTKEKAVSVAISENPELYREYIEGGAN